jgi:hypothetical protein
MSEPLRASPYTGPAGSFVYADAYRDLVAALQRVDREISGASFEHIGHARGIIAEALRASGAAAPEGTP